jgi:hypothetical protein
MASTDRAIPGEADLHAIGALGEGLKQRVAALVSTQSRSAKSRAGISVLVRAVPRDGNADRLQDATTRYHLGRPWRLFSTSKCSVKFPEQSISARQSISVSWQVSSTSGFRRSMNSNVVVRCPILPRTSSPLPGAAFKSLSSWVSQGGRSPVANQVPTFDKVKHKHPTWPAAVSMQTFSHWKVRGAVNNEPADASRKSESHSL